MEKNEEQEVFYIQCEKKLKADFYKMAKEKELSPGSLVRAFMRKAVSTWKEERVKKNNDASDDDFLKE